MGKICVGLHTSSELVSIHILEDTSNDVSYYAPKSHIDWLKKEFPSEYERVAKTDVNVVSGEIDYTVVSNAFPPEFTKQQKDLISLAKYLQL